MNKLRELIAKVKRQDSTFEEAIEYARWFNTHVEAIADLIDAAQNAKHNDHYGKRCICANCEMLNAALAKLTEDK